MFNLLMGQIKPRKGDYAYNLHLIGDIFDVIARENMATDVLVLPETVLSGYFLEGGVGEIARTAGEVFADLQAEYIDRLGAKAPFLDIVLGFYEEHAGRYYNSAMYVTVGGPEIKGPEISSGGGVLNPCVVHVHRKFFLATYGVFDEKRFVTRGQRLDAFQTRFGPAAILICEDVWHTVTSTTVALKGAQILYIPTASPARGFDLNQPTNINKWQQINQAIADEHNIYVVNTSLCGFEGGKGFLGRSHLVDPYGKLVAEGPLFEEALIEGHIDLADVPSARANNPLLADLDSYLPDVIQQLTEVSQLKKNSW